MIIKNNSLSCKLIKIIFTSFIIVGAFSTANVQAESSPAAFTTSYRYDAGSRIVGIIKPDPDGDGPLHYAAVRNTYDSLGMLVKVEKGELTSWQPETTYPSGWPGFTVFQTLDSTYDIWGRKLTEKVTEGAPITLSQFSYDVAGRIECTAVRMNPAIYDSLPQDACTLGTEGNNGPDRVTRQTYDSLSRPITTQKGYGTSQQIDYLTTEYYTGGPKRSQTDANGNMTSYVYDGLMRLSQVYFPSKTMAGKASGSDYEEYGYDDNGNRITLKKRDGKTINYIYDNLNRLSETHYPTGTIRDVFNGYDLRNLELYARYDSPAGNGITTEYDGFGNVKSSTTNLENVTRKLTYLYDAEGHRTRLTFPDAQYFTYGYDGLGRLSNIRESGITVLIENTYDSRGYRKAISHGGPASAPVSQTTFLYDQGRLATLTHDFDGASSNYDQIWNFVYNPASQLTGRRFSNSQYLYVQPAAKNITYLVNGLNQYTSVSGMAAPGPNYDDNGNMTADGSSLYGYDLENRLTSSLLRTINYDPKGRLYQTTGGDSGTTVFLFDGDALVAEYNSSGTMLRRYVHGSELDEPMVQYNGAMLGISNRNYLHADHQGSIVAITNGSGSTKEIETYDEYGIAAAGNHSRFQYTGQIALPDFGMYYYKARIYNPGLGRFMQTDPIGYNDDINLYTYVGDSPLSARDPSGKYVFLVGQAVRWGVGVGVSACVAAPGCRKAASDAGSAVGRSASFTGKMMLGAAFSVLKMSNVIFNSGDDTNTPGTKDSDKGCIYCVPGDKTSSGNDYIGSTDDMDQRKRDKSDGRDREGARIVGEYDKGNRDERRNKEQQAINDHGGVENLDNRRNERAERKWPANGITPPTR